MRAVRLRSLAERGILRMGMDSGKACADDPAKRWAAIAEEHLRGLSPEERADRLQAFDQVVAKIGPGLISEVEKRKQAAK